MCRVIATGPAWKSQDKFLEVKIPGQKRLRLFFLKQNNIQISPNVPVPELSLLMATPGDSSLGGKEGHFANCASGRHVLGGRSSVYSLFFIMFWPTLEAGGQTKITLGYWSWWFEPGSWVGKQPKLCEHSLERKVRRDWVFTEPPPSSFESDRLLPPTSLFLSFLALVASLKWLSGACSLTVPAASSYESQNPSTNRCAWSRGSSREVEGSFWVCEWRQRVQNT